MAFLKTSNFLPHSLPAWLLQLASHLETCLCSALLCWPFVSHFACDPRALLWLPRRVAYLFMLCVIWFYSPFFFCLFPSLSFCLSISTSLPSLNVQRTLPRPLLTWATPSSYLSFYLFNFHVKLLLPFALSTSQSLSLSLFFSLSISLILSLSLSVVNLQKRSQKLLGFCLVPS